MKLKDKIKFYGWQLVLCTGLILMLNMQPENVDQQYWINISGIVMMYVGGMKLKKYLDLIDADSRDVWSDNENTVMNMETKNNDDLMDKGKLQEIDLSSEVRVVNEYHQGGIYVYNVSTDSAQGLIEMLSAKLKSGECMSGFQLVYLSSSKDLSIDEYYRPQFENL